MNEAGNKMEGTSDGILVDPELGFTLGDKPSDKVGTNVSAATVGDSEGASVRHTVGAALGLTTGTLVAGGRGLLRVGATVGT